MRETPVLRVGFSVRNLRKNRVVTDCAGDYFGVVMNKTFSPADQDDATQASLDYQRIEKAIRYLQEHFLEQPDLATIARAAHLSEYHFQRLFSRWAGISPKRFLQFLTVEHAKHRLADAKALLEVTFDSGLLSPGQLHDQSVSVQAVTPGESKTAGPEV